MTNKTPSQKTPDRVAKLATTDHSYKRFETDLIGVFGSQSHMSALIRTASGSIRRVEVGETLDIGRIVAIDKEGIMVSKKGRNRRLAMPAG